MADLMERGFHVYRAVSPSCPCDLVVWKDRGRVILIEVKTAGFNASTGHVSMSKAPKNVFDVLCHVTPQGLIYDPPIEEWDA